MFGTTQTGDDQPEMEDLIIPCCNRNKQIHLEYGFCRFLVPKRSSVLDWLQLCKNSFSSSFYSDHFDYGFSRCYFRCMYAFFVCHFLLYIVLKFVISYVFWGFLCWEVCPGWNLLFENWIGNDNIEVISWIYV